MKANEAVAYLLGKTVEEVTTLTPAQRFEQAAYASKFVLHNAKQGEREGEVVVMRLNGSLVDVADELRDLMGDEYEVVTGDEYPSMTGDWIVELTVKAVS